MEHSYHGLNFKEAWHIIQEEAINKIIDSFETEEGLHRQLFTPEQYMRIYTIAYTICIDKSRTSAAQTVYDKCKKTLEDYTSAKVLPSLRGKKKEVLLQDLVKQWNNHKRLTLWFSRFFSYLELYFVPANMLRSLKGTSHSIFYEVVYGEISDQILGVVLSLIRNEREEMKIDQTLVKNVLEMGEDSTIYYKKDFEGPLLDETRAFYSTKAQQWSPVLSHHNYMLKIDECLNQEKDRINAYLSNISQKDELLDLVRKELNMDERNR